MSKVCCIAALRAIVDSGAYATMIPLRWLRQIPVYRSEQAWLSTPAGSRRLVDLYVVSLRLGGYQREALPVVAVQDTEEAILGRDVLNHLIVTLNGLASVTEISE